MDYSKEIGEWKAKMNGPDVEVRWDLEGLHGGYCVWTFPDRIVLRLNKGIWEREGHEEYLKIVAHEYAHAIVAASWWAAGRPRQVGFWSSHGGKWQDTMWNMGFRPTRCHQYEVTRKVDRRDFAVGCGVCGKRYLVTKVLVSRMTQKNYRCKCGRRVRLLEDLSATELMAGLDAI